MPSSKPQILICGSLVRAIGELRELELDFQVLVLDVNSNRAAFFESCASGEYNSLSAIYRHNDSASTIGIFDAELIKNLPPSLKFICHNGAGYDQIDVKACTDRGIQVSNTPSAVDDATATVGMFLIISALRQFYKAEMTCRAGVFKIGTTPAHDPENKVLGIVGMGGIGRALAKRALGFDMKIQYHNRNPVDQTLLKDFPKDSIKYASTLDELLRTSDVVSLNLPLNRQTQGFFGKAQFSTMKKGSVLINTARGGVVDEEALLEALETGHASSQLYSAGLDVFPDEPNINPKLLANDKLTLLPHMGTETEESQKKMEVLVLTNIKTGLQTGKVLTLIPEQRGNFE